MKKIKETKSNMKNENIVLTEEENLSKKKRKKIEILNSKYEYDINEKFALKISDVYKSYGQKKVLNGVSFEIKKGERVSLIGKNGSGKSTLISVVSQQIRMSKGLISYGYAKNKIGSLEGMGIQFQTLLYPEGFIVKDVIHFFNVSVDKSKRMSKSELSDIISLFGINQYLEQKIDRLSGGQQQRINILLALIKKPKLLILDEISTGLDVESSEKIKAYIEKYLDNNKDVALLLISHSDEEIVEMTNKVFVLEKGEIVEEFESKKLTNKKFFEITSREPKEEDPDVIKKNNARSEKLMESFIKSYGEKDGFKPEDDPWNENSFKNKFLGKIDNLKIGQNNVIEINDLSKTYGKTVGAVRNLSLTIKDGERIAVTGPNGSGKTTFIEIISFVKTYDKISKKFRNLINLSKSDLTSELEKNKKFVDIELRKLKNAYRIERENSVKKINLLKSDDKRLIESLEEKKKQLTINCKENIKKLNEDKTKDDTKEKINTLKDSLKEAIKNTNIEIEKSKTESAERIKIETKNINLEVDKKVEKMKEDYKEVEIKLNEELKSKNIETKLLYKNKKEEIVEYKNEAKKSEKSAMKKNKEEITLLKTTSKEEIATLKEKEEVKNFKKTSKEEITLLKTTLKEELEEANLTYKEKILSFKETFKENVQGEKEEIDILKTTLKEDLKNTKYKNKKAILSIEAIFDEGIKKVEVKDELTNYKKVIKEEVNSLKGKGNLVQVGGYNDNGKEVKVTRSINNLPTLSYSFATTKRQVKDETGVQFQYASFPVEMSVKDVILFFSRTNKYYLSTKEIVEAIKVFKLEELLKRKAYKLSGGERQRLNVLLSIMKSPKILILDEISTGLDVDSIVKIDKFIKEYLDKTKATLILISHNYHEVHSLTNKIVVMKRGELKEVVDTTSWKLEKIKNKMREIYKGGAI